MMGLLGVCVYLCPVPDLLIPYRALCGGVSEGTLRPNLLYNMDTEPAASSNPDMSDPALPNNNYRKTILKITSWYNALFEKKLEGVGIVILLLIFCIKLPLQILEGGECAFITSF